MFRWNTRLFLCSMLVLLASCENASLTAGSSKLTFGPSKVTVVDARTLVMEATVSNQADIPACLFFPAEGAEIKVAGTEVRPTYLFEHGLVDVGNIEELTGAAGRESKYFMTLQTGQSYTFESRMNLDDYLIPGTKDEKFGSVVNRDAKFVARQVAYSVDCKFVPENGQVGFSQYLELISGGSVESQFTSWSSPFNLN